MNGSRIKLMISDASSAQIQQNMADEGIQNYRSVDRSDMGGDFNAYSMGLATGVGKAEAEFNWQVVWSLWDECFVIGWSVIAPDPLAPNEAAVAPNSFR